MKRDRESWQGMNWIRPATRLAIYMRDDMTCVWCLKSVRHGARLTLDHVRPVTKGGDNAPSNLITACSRCNVRRYNKGIRSFATKLARESHIEPFAERVAHETVKRVRNARRRTLPRKPARQMLNQMRLNDVLYGLYGIDQGEVDEAG